MKILRYATAALALLPASPLYASQTTAGYIFGFQHLANGIVFFQTNGTRSSMPSCQNANYPKRWAFDATTAAGQTLLATVLTNYALHQAIEVYGTGACTVSGDNETIGAVNTDNV